LAYLQLVASQEAFYVSSLPDESTPEDLDAAISRISPDKSRQAAALAFRIPSSTLEMFGSSLFESTRRIISRRVRGKRVFLFSYSFIEKTHQVASLSLRGVSVPRSQRGLLSAIRQSELAAIIRDSSELCFLNASKTFHFLTPSHIHCERYLRVGDAIRSMETLDKLAFWILPQVHHADVFLSDVWGIASVVIRAMHMLSRAIPLDCLGEYPNRPSSSAEQTIAQLLEAIAQPSVRRS
jgi:hypothetical protein